MKTKNEFSLLKDLLPDTTAEKRPPPQKNRPKIVGLVTERGRGRGISKVNNRLRKYISDPL